MSYILSEQRDSDGYTPEFWRQYLDYLGGLKDRFPKNAYRIATSDWWYSFNTARAPHDSRLISATLSDEQIQGRDICSLVIKLASAHGGTIQLTYPRVKRYQLSMPTDPWPSHGDWRFDEFSLSEDGFLVHTIEWGDGPTWVITSDNLKHKYIPKPRPTA